MWFIRNRLPIHVRPTTDNQQKVSISMLRSDEGLLGVSDWPKKSTNRMRSSLRNGTGADWETEQRILHFPSNIAGFLHCNACQSTGKSEETWCEKEIILIWYEKYEVMSITCCAETTSWCVSRRNERRFYGLIWIREEKTNRWQVTLQAFIGDSKVRVMHWINGPLF